MHFSGENENKVYDFGTPWDDNAAHELFAAEFLQQKVEAACSGINDEPLTGAELQSPLGQSESYRCRYCLGQFSWKDIALTHGLEKELFVCKFCQRPYGCDDCERRFCKRRFLQEHKRIAHSAGKNRFLCNLCSKTFTKLRSLKSHAKYHHIERPFGCSYCNKKFVNHKICESHEKTHTEDKPFGCKHCEKKFALLAESKKHQFSHKLEELTSGCSLRPRRICGGSKIARKDTAREKPFECHYCQKRFRLDKNRCKHVLNHHAVDRPYGCDYCDKRFFQRTARDQHERRHTREKTFVCIHCDERFLLAGQLKKHANLTHAEELPFGCTYCEQKFENYTRCKNHERTHKGEKSSGVGQGSDKVNEKNVSF